MAKSIYLNGVKLENSLNTKEEKIFAIKYLMRFLKKHKVWNEFKEYLFDKYKYENNSLDIIKHFSFLNFDLFIINVVPGIIFHSDDDTKWRELDKAFMNSLNEKLNVTW